MECSITDGRVVDADGILMECLKTDGRVGAATRNVEERISSLRRVPVGVASVLWRRR